MKMFGFAYCPFKLEPVSFVHQPNWSGLDFVYSLKSRFRRFYLLAFSSTEPSFYFYNAINWVKPVELNWVKFVYYPRCICIYGALAFFFLEKIMQRKLNPIIGRKYFNSIYYLHTIFYFCLAGVEFDRIKTKFRNDQCVFFLVGPPLCGNDAIGLIHLNCKRFRVHIWYRSMNVTGFYCFKFE